MDKQIGLSAGREKYWSELDEPEKIERLREYAQRVEYLTERINKLEVALERHDHKDGKVIMEVPYGTNYQDIPRSTRHSCFGCETCKNQVRI